MFLPFLKNPFATKKMARQDFLDLMDGTLSRMAGQNAANRYSAQMAALQPLRDAYATFLGTQDVALGEQYGRTDAVNEVMADFKQFAKKELLVDVAYVFGRRAPDAAALTQFLPKGRSEYSAATLLTLPVLLDRVATLTTAHQAALGQPLADRAAELKQAYQAARQDQGQSKGAVQGDSKEERALRKAAARQLKRNLLAQLDLHIDAPDDVKALYDPRIFTQPANPAQA